MARTQTLEKRAKEFIIQQMEDKGEMERDEVIELIRPHFNFDPTNAREQALNRKAQQLMSQLKDEKGARTCFNYKKDGISSYVNVDATTDLHALNEVEKQLSAKYIGLNASRAKVQQRKQELSGQLTLDLDAI